MNKSFLLSFILFLFVLSNTAVYAQNTVDKRIAITENYSVPAGVDLHLSDEVSPIRNNAVIDLPTESSWLYIDNIKPSNVIKKYASNITIKGEAIKPEENCRLSIQKHGTAIIPHTPDFKPLEVFKGQNFTGESMKYEMLTFHDTLDTFDNAIRSFKLKKGYMATLFNDRDGRGFSRVFIADEADVEVPVMQIELDQKVSYLRVFRWENVNKKGWAGSAAGGDFLDCTWNYTWASDTQSTDNVEFVPIRQTEWWPGWDEIYGRNRSTHLLGYNEPDHVEQSNAQVSTAVAQWPSMMKSGLRVGSPATTDFSWLYKFMDECEALNYRVDYVVIHAYWGGMSADRWYRDMKAVHTRTKRPIWIKEWNNGANWTNEWWPSDPVEQQQKQERELRAIINVMDTASFIERYSIYNWVEDKRAMVLKNPKTGIEDSITLAGQFYKDNRPAIAFNREKEVFPIWKTLPVTLRYVYDGNSKKVVLNWTNLNRELSKEMVVERKVGSDPFVEIARFTDGNISAYNEILNESMAGRVSYRLKVIGIDNKEVASNAVELYCVPKGGNVIIDKASLSQQTWTPFVFNEKYSETPKIIFGTPSYFFKSPMTIGIKGQTAKMFQFRFYPWSYLNTTMQSSESIPYMTILEGEYDWNGVKAQVGTATNVSAKWLKISFEKPFDVVPVVIATQSTSKSSFPQAPRVRNITKTDFEIMMQKEDAVTQTPMRESVDYIAVTPGVGMVNGAKLYVGMSAGAVVGNSSRSYTINFDTNIENPALFAFLQTANDEITATLRNSSISSTSATVFKQREASKTGTAVSQDQVGWMLLDLSSVTGIETPSSYDAVSLYPNPASDRLFIKGIEDNARIAIYDVLGNKYIDQMSTGEVSLDGVPSGYCILLIDGVKSISFIKK